MADPDLSDAAREVIAEYAPPSATVLRPVLLALARHVLTLLGTAIAAHGWVDDKTAASVVEPLAQEAVGAILVVIGAGGSALRAVVSHSRWADAWSVLVGHANATVLEKQR